MDTRSTIIKVTLRLLAAEGAQGISMRKVAEQAGIKAASIYEHFPNKAALLHEVRVWAWQELLRFIDEHRKARGTAGRLVEAGMAYYHFSIERREIFSLLFHELGSVRGAINQPVDARSPYSALLVLTRQLAHGDQDMAEQIAFGLWSMAHGAAVLRQTHLGEFHETIERALQKNLKVFVKAFEGEP